MDVEKQEQKLWDDMRENWEYIDKVYATYDEYNQFKRVTLSEEQIKDPLEAFFRPEKRMFMEDVCFVVVRNDEPYRIIFLNYKRNDLSFLTVFDKDGDLVGKMIIRVNEDDVSASLDKKNPIGSKYLKREAEKYFYYVQPGLSPQQMMKEIEQKAIAKIAGELSDVIQFILAAMHHVLHTVEVRTVSSEPIESSRPSRPNQGRRSATIVPKKLTRIVYEGRKVRKAQRKEFTQHVDSWKVRGHWRIYSDGKRTWVKPHIKGRKSKKYRPRGTEYKI
jgi:hypothetical protein